MWSGDVELIRSNGSAITSHAVNFGWICDGRYVKATRMKGTDSTASECFVVFRAVTEKNVVVRFLKRGGKGNAAVTGIHSVPDMRNLRSPASKLMQR